MDKFCIRVGASASSNSSAVASIAAQPEANASSSSAAQPAVQLKSINDVKRWLSTFAEHEPDEKVIKHKSHDVEKELKAKVLHEATRLRKLLLRGSSGASSSQCSALRQAFARNLPVATDSAVQPAAQSGDEPQATKAAVHDAVTAP